MAIDAQKRLLVTVKEGIFTDLKMLPSSFGGQYPFPWVCRLGSLRPCSLSTTHTATGHYSELMKVANKGFKDYNGKESEVVQGQKP